MRQILKDVIARHPQVPLQTLEDVTSNAVAIVQVRLDMTKLPGDPSIRAIMAARDYKDKDVKKVFKENPGCVWVVTPYEIIERKAFARKLEPAPAPAPALSLSPMYLAGLMFTAYCQTRGVAAADGKMTPWAEFSVNPRMKKQTEAWVAAAKAVLGAVPPAAVPAEQSTSKP